MNNTTESYADLARRYTNGESIQIAGTVFWNVVETAEKPGGLAGRATSGMRAKDLALGVALGPAGVLLSVLSDKKEEPAKCACDLGILAVGNRNVFLIKLGTFKMIGESATDARLPPELVDHTPTALKAMGVIAFRPLNVTTDLDTLRVHVLGSPPAAFDSAFSDHGSCLVVRAPGRDMDGSFGARSLASAIRGFAAYPLPEEVMASLFVTDRPSFSQRAESAFSESDYAQSFVPVYKRQKKEVRRAFVLSARVGPEGFKGVAGMCARSAGRGSGNQAFKIFSGMVCLAPLMFLSVMTLYVFATGQGMGATAAPDAGEVFWTIFGLAVFVGSSCLGLWLLYSVRSGMRERRLECRLFEEGGGFCGSLDTLLALLAWDKDWRARVDWNEMETALASNPQFVLQLCETLRRMKKEDRKAFILSAPRELREKLIGTMLEFKGAVSPTATISYVAMWLPCLALGIYGATHGFQQGTPTMWDWFVFIFGMILGFGGGLIALVLLGIQISAWQDRRWVRTVSRNAESEVQDAEAFQKRLEKGSFASK